MIRRATVVFISATALIAAFGCTSYFPVLNQVGLLPGPPASLLLGALTGTTGINLGGSSSSTTSTGSGLGSLVSNFLDKGSSSLTGSTTSTTSTTNTNSTSSSTTCPSGQVYVGTARGVAINACVPEALAQQYGAI